MQANIGEEQLQQWRTAAETWPISSLKDPFQSTSPFGRPPRKNAATGGKNATATAAPVESITATKAAAAKAQREQQALFKAPLQHVSTYPGQSGMDAILSGVNSTSRHPAVPHMVTGLAARVDKSDLASPMRPEAGDIGVRCARDPFSVSVVY